MKVVRYGSFETNSSSTHAIVVPKNVKNDDYDLRDSLEHNYEFGREECRLCSDWDEKLAYTYLTLKNFDNEEQIKKFKDNIKMIYNEICSSFNIYSDFTLDEFFNYLDSDREDGNITGDDSFYVIMDSYGKYVDHSYELKDTGFIERILDDKEFLKRFIFNRKSYITIGGDEYRGYNIKTIGFEYDYESDYINHGTEECPQYEDVGEFWDKLKEYEKENDVFLKGN